jgi:hypothetical protein
LTLILGGATVGVAILGGGILAGAILGGAALQRCGSRIVLNAALAAED